MSVTVALFAAWAAAYLSLWATVLVRHLRSSRNESAALVRRGGSPLLIEPFEVRGR